MGNEICIICKQEFSDGRLKCFRLGVETTKVQDFARGSKANEYPNFTILKRIWKHNCEVDGEQGGSWYIFLFQVVSHHYQLELAQKVTH